jgi:hypothetical protein
MAADEAQPDEAATTNYDVELGPLFATGVILVAVGVVRRSALLVAGGVGAVWLDQRTAFGQSLKERARRLSAQVVDDEPGR